MREHEREHERQDALPAQTTPRGLVSASPRHAVFELQRRYGNRGVQRLLAPPVPDRPLDPELVEAIDEERPNGRPLADASRRDLEPRLATDLRGVRIHTGPRADMLSRLLDAEAFTTGSDVFFRDGAFQPHTAMGRALLAHELAHVVQQRGARPDGDLVLGRPDDAFERAADDVAASTASRSPHAFADHGPAVLPAVQRVTVAQERAWEVEHPQGEVTQLDDYHWILWNFDVDGADLKPEHVAALNRVLERFGIVSLLDTEASILIEGHASSSGAKRENDHVSHLRAEHVRTYVRQHHVSWERLHTLHFGSSRPRIPNVTGGSAARNRRVEVQIKRGRDVTTAPPPRRMPQPPPRREGEEVEHGPATWTKFVPGAAFAYEWGFPLGRIPAGHFMLYPKLKVKVKGEVETQLGVAPEWTLSKDGLERTVRAKLPHDVAFEGKLTPEGHFEGGFTFEGVAFKPQVMATTDPLAPIKFQLSYAPDPEHPPLEREFELDDGAKLKVAVELEGECGVGLNAAALAAHAGEAAAGAELAEGGGVLAALGPTGVATGVVVINLVWLGFVAYQVVEAGKEGAEYGATISRRRGYAWRIVGEAYPEDWNYILQMYEGQIDSGSWTPMYEGWSTAHEAIRRAGSETQRLMGAVTHGRRHDIVGLHEHVFQLVGGYGREPKPLPGNLADLLR